MNPIVPTPASARWDAIDVARGIAIVAMAIYHFGWDLSFLQLIETNIVVEPAWQWFARLIAGSFLFLSGIGLVLAHRQGFRQRAFLMRLSKVGGAAIAVTLATLLAFPDTYIFFGILHCIAVSGVLALPFLRAPGSLTLAGALFAFLAPWLLTDPALDHELLDWLGLGSSQPRTNDYVPIFPWFGAVLIGVLAGKLLISKREPLLSAWHARSSLARGLRFAGRQSLPIYLVHQPVLLAVLYGILQVAGPNPRAESARFVRQCTEQCAASSVAPAECSTRCSCILDGLKAAELWPRVARTQANAADEGRVSALARQCSRAPGPAPG